MQVPSGSLHDSDSGCVFCVLGVIVCVLALAALQPGVLSNTLLLTRLEKDSPPITVKIPTAQNKVGLCTQDRCLQGLWVRDGKVRSIREDKPHKHLLP